PGLSVSGPVVQDGVPDEAVESGRNNVRVLAPEMHGEGVDALSEVGVPAPDGRVDPAVPVTGPHGHCGVYGDQGGVEPFDVVLHVLLDRVWPPDGSVHAVNAV